MEIGFIFYWIRKTHFPKIFAFSCFGIEHQLQRFDKRIVAIDIPEQYTPLELYKKFFFRTAQLNSK